MSKKFSLLTLVTLLVCMSVNAHADPNLLGHYTFDSQNADDSSGYGHDGYSQGDVSYVYDAVRDSYVLSLTNSPEDGWGNCINVGGNSYDYADPDWSNRFKHITVAAWATIDEFNATYQYLAAKEGSWRMMRYSTSDEMRFYTNSTGSTSLVGDEDSNIQGGDWHHVACIYDGSVKQLYIDGELNATQSTNGNPLRESDYNIIIGGTERDDSQLRQWNGKIDDVRLYNRALSYKELREIAEAYSSAGHWPNGETGLPIEVQLSWIAAFSESRTFNVYYGTDSDDVAGSQAVSLLGDTVLVAGHASTTVTQTLSSNTTYYWRVDVVDGATVYADESIHSFATAQANSHNFLPPDNMSGIPYDGVIFTWEPGSLPVDGYNVYIGTTTSNLAKANSTLLTDLNFVPTGLNEFTTYYWKVEDVSATPVFSPVMSFSTSGTVDPNLIGWWRFDNENAVDISGVGHHGVEVGAVSYAYDPDLKNTVLIVENEPGSSENYINCGGDGELWAGGTDQITVMCWTRIDAFTTNLQRLIHKSGSWDLQRYNTTDRMKVQLDGIQGVLNGNLTTVPGGDWHHVAFTYSAQKNVRALYIDGMLDKSITSSAPTPLMTAGDFIIGGSWNGAIDDVRVYDYDMTIQQIRDIFMENADYTLIDDMESYDDTTNLISGTGGWYVEPGVQGSSSLGKAENTEPAFLDQSLKFSYDNTGYISTYFNSECAKTFDSTMNWAEDNLAFLTINFYGSEFNIPEKLYVALEDGDENFKTLCYNDYFDDPNVLMNETWQTWEIPLTDFDGVDFTKVKKIYLGCGTRFDDNWENNNDKRFGVVYFDDIMVNPATCKPQVQKPAGDVTDDCVVDMKDVQLMADNWLIHDVTIVPQSVDDANLAGCWNFDDENADDSSGNGHHGTELGTVEYIFDANRNSTVLSLTNDSISGWGNCIDVGGGDKVTDPDWANGLQQITIAAWATIDEFNVEYQYLAAKEGSWRVMRMNLEDKMRYYTNSVGNSSLAGNEDSDIQGGDWHHVACVYDGDAKYIYIDGMLNATQSANGNPVKDSTNNVVIGGTERGDSQSRQWNGKIDDFRIYDRALSYGEIRTLAEQTENLLIQIDTPANLVTVGTPGQESVNYKDFGVIADTWLDELLWP